MRPFRHTPEGLYKYVENFKNIGMEFGQLGAPNLV